MSSAFGPVSTPCMAEKLPPETTLLKSVKRLLYELTRLALPFKLDKSYCTKLLMSPAGPPPPPPPQAVSVLASIVANAVFLSDLIAHCP